MKHKHAFSTLFPLFLGWIALSIFSLISNHASPIATERPDSQSLLDAIEASLESDVADVWYPRILDQEYGGFLTRFDAQWKEMQRQDKGIVTQSRHIWTCNRLFERYPEKNHLEKAVRRGIEFVRQHFWDELHGGFFWIVERSGKPLLNEAGLIEKRTYGNAFAIYSLAAAYDVTGNTSALELAQKGFGWLETHAHDPEYGGYYNILSREGLPIWDMENRRYPKGQNTTIHLLEAFTELYRVWPDPKLKTRIQELESILLEKVIDPRGFLIQFFDRQWNPFSYADLSKKTFKEVYYWDHVSYGHDVETAFLLWEADDVLGGRNEADILKIGKQLLDHCIVHGWDPETGSIPDGAFYFKGETSPTVVNARRAWWAQAELLNALLMFDSFFPKDPHHYGKKAEQVWNYIEQNLIDPENGGWYELGIDRNPESENWPKAHIWKGAYHNSRALINARHWLDNHHQN